MSVHIPSRFTERSFSARQFLVVLVGMLIGVPFVEPLQRGDMIASALITAVLLSAVIAIGGHRRMRLVALTLVVPALAARWIHHLRPELMPRPIATVATIAFAGFVVVSLLRFVLRARSVDLNVLCAASSTYLMIGFVWAFGYVLVGELSANAFRFPSSPVSSGPLVGFDALYFSYSTLTTVGYGDIVPVSRAARILVVSEAVTGLFFMTVLIARLVTLYSTNPGPGAVREGSTS